MPEQTHEEPLASSTNLLDNEGTTVRIVGDGTTRGTKVMVVNPDGSETPLRGVQRIEYAIAIDQQPIRARITVRKVEVDMTVKADIIEVDDDLQAAGS